MARVPSRALSRYADALSETAGRAGRDVSGAVLAFARAHPEASVAQVRSFASAACYRAVSADGDACAALACQLFDQVMAAEGVDAAPAEPYGGPDAGAIDRGARYQAGKLVSGDLQGFADGMSELASYHTRAAANTTMERNVERAAGRGVRFARVPTGAETCTYCTMLASRGFVYKSEASAGHANHRGCNCLVVPGVQGRTKVDGYDPRALYDRWKAFEEIDADKTLSQAQGRTVKAAIANGETLPAAMAELSAGHSLFQDAVTLRIPKDYDGSFEDFTPLEISEQTRESLRSLRELSLESGYEYAVLITQSGPGEYVTSQLPGAVRVVVDEADGPNVTLLHSHTNVTPLSRKDFKYFCNEQVMAVGNIAANGDTFIATVGNGWRPTPEEFDRITRQIAHEVDSDMVKMIGFENWTPEERNYMAIREQAYRIARHFEWDMMGGRIDA